MIAVAVRWYLRYRLSYRFRGTACRPRPAAPRARPHDSCWRGGTIHTATRRLLRLVTDRAGRSLIFTTIRTSADWYPLFPIPVFAESILDRIVNLATRR
jgi:hypothetical protein